MPENRTGVRMKVISEKSNHEYLHDAAEALLSAQHPVALTGAGISVGSGIPDFRSPGGLWSVYNPDEYATLDVFYQHPGKAWKLYRALGDVLVGTKANTAHRALAELERKGVLKGVVTQNVDALHQAAGSKTVFEIHGDHQNLQCLACGHREPVTDEHYRACDIPHCPECSFPLKPNIVLFGESVRNFDQIELLVGPCDLLLVIGTSAQVYPAAGIPQSIKQRGGTIFEFNQDPALGVNRITGLSSITDYFFHGDVLKTLPLLTATLANRI